MTRRTAAWMPLYIEAYDRKTLHLSEAEDGVYGRLLRHYWVGGSLPDDDTALARIARVERKAWSKYRPALIGFFEVRDGRWFQSRVEEELAKSKDVSERRAEAGAKGGRPKKQTESKKKPIGFPNGLQTGTHARVEKHLTDTLPSEVTQEADASFVGDEDEIFSDRPQTPSKSAKRTKGHRLAPGWHPTHAEMQFASNAGLTPQEITHEADQFRDYWCAKAGSGATKLDWTATWQRWVRTAAQQKGNRFGRPAGSGARAPEPANERRANTESRRDAWAELIEAHDADPGDDADGSGEGGYPRDVTPRLRLASGG